MIVSDRLLELIGILLRRPLTYMEARELKESYEYLANASWRQARIYNLLKLARDTCDWTWFQTLSQERERLEGR